ncbi:MAG: DeoR family transcriptional regulator [bacterium]
MPITERQEKILDALVREYICWAEPVSSKLLKQRADLSVSPATIRNDFQELTEAGYIAQPHTSAGRVPTEKAYRYFVDKLFENEQKLFSNFIFAEIENARKQIENELKLAEELTKSLEQMSSTLKFTSAPEKDTIYQILIRIGPSRTTYDKNISLINEVIKQLEGF